jgi:hypothetical protein
MKPKMKKFTIFIALFILIFILFSLMMNLILPVKTSMISENIGRYNSGDILFHIESEAYTINDYILYRPSSKQSTLVAKIVEINLDNTFKVIGTNTEPIDDLDQNNLKQEQIIGKVIFSTSMYIFYPVIISITLTLSYFLTRFISKKIKKKMF